MVLSSDSCCLQVVPSPILYRLLLLGTRHTACTAEPSQLCRLPGYPMALLQHEDQMYVAAHAPCRCRPDEDIQTRSKLSFVSSNKITFVTANVLAPSSLSSGNAAACYHRRS